MRHYLKSVELSLKVLKFDTEPFCVRWCTNCDFAVMGAR